MEEAQVLADRVVVIAGGRVDRRGHAGHARARRPASRSSPTARDGRVVALPHRHADPRPRPAPRRGRRARRGARGPDRHPPQPRGRLPRAHRGAAHDHPQPSPPAGPLDRGARAHDAALAARARLHLRVPARARVAVRLAQRRPKVAAPRAATSRFAQYYTPVDRRLRAHARVLHEPVIGRRHGARDRAAQARARHAAADRGLPRRVDDRRRRWSASPRCCCCSSSPSPRSASRLRAHAAGGAAHARARRGVPRLARARARRRWRRPPTRRMPLAQLTFLPISFISGVWFPITDAPSWLVHLAAFFPLKHLVDAFSACFVPGGSVDGCGDLALARDLGRGRDARGGPPAEGDRRRALSADSQLPLR